LLGRSGLRVAVLVADVVAEAGGNVEVEAVRDRDRGGSEGSAVDVAVAVAAGEVRRCAVKTGRS
jgi:hypothetical protein